MTLIVDSAPSARKPQAAAQRHGARPVVRLAGPADDGQTTDNSGQERLERTLSNRRSLDLWPPDLRWGRQARRRRRCPTHRESLSRQLDVASSAGADPPAEDAADEGGRPRAGFSSGPKRSAAWNGSQRDAGAQLVI